MAMEVTQVLLNAQAIDASVRKQAEDSLRQFQEQNLPSFLLSVSGELANEEKPVDSRKLAGLVLKNALDAKEQHRKFELVQRWLALDGNAKTQIKTFLLSTLSSPVADARSTASQVIAKVAGIELPQKQWPELIGSLLLNAHQQSTHVKQATLETLGYLCEEVSPDVVDQDQVNKILTAVVQGMNASEGNNDVRLAATRSLYNALGFAEANFSNDMERDYIMRVVCEATLSPEVKIRQASFECLVSIASTYYDKLARYMQDIFGITAKAVKEDEEPVALQAIEFWSSICDEEIDILEEYGEDCTGDSDVPCFYFIKQALPALVPMLLETLLKQEEDQDQDEGAWNIAMAGGTCLGLVARTVGDDIVPLVMPFIEENITKSDWRQREAATYAFGSILEGPAPEKLTPIVNVALAFMLTALTQDPNNHVKDTTAWTLGRIFEFLHGSSMDTPIINQANCQQIITVLLQSMKDVPNVCDGASFASHPEGETKNGNKLYFRGQLIWEALMDELLSVGLSKARQALLSGCSAGGLATLIHCDDFRELLPKDATVKCLADAGFFLDEKDVSGNHTMRSFYHDVFNLQNTAKSLPKDCTATEEPSKCLFPQEIIKHISTPVFLVNPAYDFWQIQHVLVPNTIDTAGSWQKCRLNIHKCDHAQLEILQGFRDSLLKALNDFMDSKEGGLFVNSCFIHCQTWMSETWHSPNSPRINKRTIAEAVGDWYFKRNPVKLIDCPFPCNPTCIHMDFS